MLIPACHMTYGIKYFMLNLERGWNMNNHVLANIKKQRWGYFFMVPALIFFVGFVLVPFIQAIKMGFYEYSLTVKEFIGIKNYVELFNDSVFLKTLSNTLKYVLVIVPLDIVISLLIAVIIYDKQSKVVSFVRGSFYLPAIIPSVCLAMVWKWLYNPTFGLFNTLAGFLGLPGIDYLGDARFAIFSVILVVITWSIGQPIILYIAALGGIPVTLHEAAEIDGANGFQKFFQITLPLLKPTTLYNVIILTIGIMQVVEVIILMTSGGPYYNTGSLLFMIYENAFKLAKFGYAAAIGNIMFVIIFILSLIQYKYLSSDIQY